LIGAAVAVVVILLKCKPRRSRTNPLKEKLLHTVSADGDDDAVSREIA